MSFETEVNEKIANKQNLPSKINISILKYFWQASPLSGGGDHIIPKFLRKLRILKNFSDNELRILSQYLHRRPFSFQEVVFNQDDNGVGFYFIFSGQVDIFSESSPSSNGQKQTKLNKENLDKNSSENHIVTLEKGEHFGELALLQENALRPVTVVAKENCELLGIFKPDVEELINNYPSIGAKLLQSVSTILANKISTMAIEMKVLKYKILKLEGRCD